jgi:hypothetical protein
MGHSARAIFSISTRNEGLCALLALTFAFMTTQSNADTCGPSASPGLSGCIEATLTLNFLDYREPDVALNFGSSESIDVAGDFVPNPPGASISFADEQAFAAQTTVTATQNNQTFNLTYLNSPALPNYFSTLIPVSSGLIGPWNLSAANPNDGTLQVFTAAIIPADTPILPFINAVQASDSTPTATLSWIQPSFVVPANETPGATIYAEDISTRTVIDLVNLNNVTQGTNSYSLNNLPTESLVAGQNYVISVGTSLFSSNGAIVSTSRSFFNFAPQATPAAFAGPFNFP